MLFSELQVNEVKLQVRFDTGCLLGCILSDSDARSLSTVMYQSERDSRTKYLLVDSISIAGTAYGTDTIYTSVSRSRSILAPHYTDEDRIWHIDLDAGVMRIDTDESVPEKALIYALDFAYKQNKKLAPMVHLPIDYTFGSDSLKTDYYYLLDTGTPYGVAITDPPSELLQFVSSISHSVYEDTWSVHNPSRLVSQFQPDVHLGNQSLQGVYCLVDTKVRSVEDTTRPLEFPDYACYEIVNELVKLLMENASDPRLQSNYTVNQTIADPTAVPQSQSSRDSS